MKTVLIALSEALIAGRSRIVIATDLHQPPRAGYGLASGRDTVQKRLEKIWMNLRLSVALY
jgi:hypothetical protein